MAGVFRTRIDSEPARSLRGDRGTSTPVVDSDRGHAQRLDLHVNVLEPATGPGPYHYHEAAENVYWVLAGEITVEAADETFVLGPGDVLFIPPGIVHATMNRSTGPAQFVEIYAPAGEDFHIVDDHRKANR